MPPGACAILVGEDFLDIPIGTRQFWMDSVYVAIQDPGTGNSSVLVLHVRCPAFHPHLPRPVTLLLSHNSLCARPPHVMRHVAPHPLCQCSQDWIRIRQPQAMGQRRSYRLCNLRIALQPACVQPPWVLTTPSLPPCHTSLVLLATIGTPNQLAAWHQVGGIIRPPPLKCMSAKLASDENR